MAQIDFRPVPVSTHSRPKAAGPGAFATWQAGRFQLTAARRRLGHPFLFLTVFQCFNSQPPEGGWAKWRCSWFKLKVSTHSRPKAAG